MDAKTPTNESVSRRDLLKTGAAGLLGAAAATALTATPASADDGDPIILGQENVATSPTRIRLDDRKLFLTIFPGPSGQVLHAEALFELGPVVWGQSFSGGPGVLGTSHIAGVVGQGDEVGVSGSSFRGTGIGVRGRSEADGTGVKAEVFDVNGTAFEAVGPVKFSTSGLAEIAASADRVTVDPGIPLTTQSKVLATLQGNTGNKSLVERVELDPAAGTFQIVLTRSSARPVQVAWFLIS